MEKERILERLNWFKNRIDELGGATYFECYREASEDEILNLENDLGYALPIEFRKALKEISSHICFFWKIYDNDNILLPKELRSIFAGALHFGIDFTLACEDSRKDWIENCFSNYEKKYDRVFYNKLAFQQIENGDFLAIDLEKDSYGKVIYLSHDGSDFHGYVISNSFSEFLEEYTNLGCVGGEDWQWEVFTNNKTSTIDSSCENARNWMKIIGRI